MDLRISRTEKNIRNAFIELRSKKPLEKITVRELSELAYINTATFYRHYVDIYALSDCIENELLGDIMDMVTESEKLLQREGILSLFDAIDYHGILFRIIFSGSRRDVAIHKIQTLLMEKIFRVYPEQQNDLERKVILSTLIYGIAQSYIIYKDQGIDREIIISTIEKMTRVLKEG